MAQLELRLKIMIGNSQSHAIGWMSESAARPAFASRSGKFGSVCNFPIKLSENMLFVRNPIVEHGDGRKSSCASD